MNWQFICIIKLSNNRDIYRATIYTLTMMEQHKKNGIAI